MKHLKKKLLAGLLATTFTVCGAFGLTACGDTQGVTDKNFLQTLVDFNDAVTTAGNFAVEISTETKINGKVPLNDYSNQKSSANYKCKLLKTDEGYFYDYTQLVSNVCDGENDGFGLEINLRGDKLYTPYDIGGDEGKNQPSDGTAEDDEDTSESIFSAPDNYEIELGTKDAFLSDMFLMRVYFFNAQYAYLYAFLADLDSTVLTGTLNDCDKIYGKENGYTAQNIVETVTAPFGFMAEEYVVTGFKASVNKDKTVLQFEYSFKGEHKAENKSDNDRTIEFKISTKIIIAAGLTKADFKVIEE